MYKYRIGRMILVFKRWFLFYWCLRRAGGFVLDCEGVLGVFNNLGIFFVFYWVLIWEIEKREDGGCVGGLWERERCSCERKKFFN